MLFIKAEEGKEQGDVHKEGREEQDSSAFRTSRRLCSVYHVVTRPRLRTLGYSFALNSSEYRHNYQPLARIGNAIGQTSVSVYHPEGALNKI